MATDSETLHKAALEDFWDDLLAFIEEGRVIPVVGPELCSVHRDGRDVPLYRSLAECLLQKYGLRGEYAAGTHAGVDGDVALRAHFELYDAVSALVQRVPGLKVSDLYRPINDLLRGLVGPDPAIPAALRELARITDFHLFVSTTFDDLLARAIDAERVQTGVVTEHIAYAPNLPGNQVRDLPEIRPSNYCAVFYLLGRASASPFFAIDDEDLLEYVYNLQLERGRSPERMLAELRRCHLLFIGCNFADWLSRIFIRLANEVRLSGDRPKQEFLIGDEVAHDQSLTLFLERFSHNTRVYPGDARRFVSELTSRWCERHPENPALSAADSRASTPAPPGAGEIFISYSHADVAAARVLLSELASIGASVIWFDKTELRPGDEWERAINAAIKRCTLFVALISANTEALTDGYFHREWLAAEKKAELILGRPFIIPVVLDPGFDGNPDQYKLIPEGFPRKQFGQAPGGRMSGELRQALTEALREVRRRRPA
jgi:hypothetical protein